MPGRVVTRGRALAEAARGGTLVDRGYRDHAILRTRPVTSLQTGLCVAGVVALGAAAFLAGAPMRARVVTPIALETSEPPVHVAAPVDGYMIRRLVDDGARVAAGAVIGVVGAPAEAADVERIGDYARNLSAALASSGPVPQAPTGSAAPDLAQEMVDARDATEALQEYLAHEPDLTAAADARAELSLLDSKRAGLIDQLRLAERRIEISTGEVQAKADLARKGYTTQSIVNATERSLIDARSRSSEISGAPVDLQQRRLELGQRIERAGRTRTETVRKLESDARRRAALLHAAVRRWDVLHRLAAPASGTVRYFDDPKRGQYISAGSDFAVIDPGTTHYTASADIPATKIRGISPGKRVVVSLDAYPARKYGRLEGKVSRVSRLARSGHYNVEFTVTSLRLAQGTVAAFSQGMPGKAEIYVDGSPFLQRLMGR